MTTLNRSTAWHTNCHGWNKVSDHLVQVELKLVHACSHRGVAIFQNGSYFSFFKLLQTIQCFIISHNLKAQWCMDWFNFCCMQAVWLCAVLVDSVCDSGRDGACRITHIGLVSWKNIQLAFVSCFRVSLVSWTHSFHPVLLSPFMHTETLTKFNEQLLLWNQLEQLWYQITHVK